MAGLNPGGMEAASWTEVLMLRTGCPEKKMLGLDHGPEWPRQGWGWAADLPSPRRAVACSMLVGVGLLVGGWLWA